MVKITHAHLERKDNGDIYGVFRLGFKRSDKSFDYCFIGKEKDKLTFDGNLIKKHPKFINISMFEDWCRRYSVEKL